MKRALSFFVFLALLAAPAHSQFQLLKSEHLGKLRMDMPRTAVIAVLGKPAQRTAEIAEEATGCFVQQWIYKGITLKMSAQRKGGNSTLSSVTIQAPCSLRTARGVHVGSSEAEVRRAYGKDIDKETSDAEHIVAGSPYGGLAFTLQHGRVTRIFLGAVAE